MRQNHLILLIALLAIIFLRVENASSHAVQQLRTDDAVATVIADLEAYIPDAMRAAQVPGVSVALVWEGQMVWARGFGLADTWSRAPVTPDTVFEAASLGKVVAAYLALQQVEVGTLALDVPLDDYLATSWLPPDSAPDEITLTDVLSHRSGLSNDSNGWRRDLLFPPGERFSYAGQGYYYMQQVLEEQGKETVETLAANAIFSPLGMESTSFIKRDDLLPRQAPGHIPALFPAGVFGLAFGVFWVGALIVFALFFRWRTGRWMLPWWAFLLAVVGAVVLTSAIIDWRFSRQYERAILGSGIPGVVLYFALAGVGFVGLRKRLEQRWTRFLLVLWLGVAAGLVALIASQLFVPVSRSGIRENVAFSLQATAGDLGLFLAEVMSPTLVDPATAALLWEPQIAVNDQISWGLGAGIQHSPDGDSIWQWGANPGYQSLMVAYPAEKIGIVVLTNSSEGFALTRSIAQRALGGVGVWEIGE